MTLILLDGERKKKKIYPTIFFSLSILSQISIFNIYDMICSEIIGVVCKCIQILKEKYQQFLLCLI